MSEQMSGSLYSSAVLSWLLCVNYTDIYLTICKIKEIYEFLYRAIILFRAFACFYQPIFVPIYSSVFLKSGLVFLDCDVNNARLCYISLRFTK